MGLIIHKKHININVILWRCLSILEIISMFTPIRAISTSENDFRYVAFNDLLSTASIYSEENVTNFSKFYFDLDKSSIFVGARNRIYRFSLQLDLMEKALWDVPTKDLDTCLAKGQSEADCHNYIMVMHKFNNKLLVCASYAFAPKCSTRNIETLELIEEETSVGKSPFNPRSNITTLMTDDGKLFIGSTIDFSGSDSVILRADLSVENSKILRTKQYNNLELYEPQFVGSFEHGEFIYFVFREVSIEVLAGLGERSIYSMIARVCKNDPGGVHIYKDNWTSFLKARLKCSLQDGEAPFYFNEVQDIVFLAEDKELYATFSTPDTSIHGSAICIFNMSSIEKAFSGSIKYQETSGSPIWTEKNLPQRNQYECQHKKSSSDFVDFVPKYQLMSNSVLSNTKNPLYVEKLEKFVHIAVTKIATKLHENVKIIFIANSSGFIKKISVLPRTKQSCLIEILEPEHIGENVIETMKFLKTTESLLLGTTNTILKIPSQRCHRYLSKMSCINSMDPYCGWNDLTLTCSTSPNNDPLTPYWFQNATTCPIFANSDVDGGWSPFSMWHKCAKSEQLNDYDYEPTAANADTCLCKTRTCNNPATKGAGKKCEGHLIMVTNCTQHGGWSDWSSYGACSQTCGIAIKVRRRTCSNPAPKHGGRLCVGNNQQEIYCHDLPPCSTTNINMQVDGGWSELSEWSNCSNSCGGGFRFRERNCNNPTPQNNGLECIGCKIEHEECNKHACNEVKKISPWTSWLLMATNESSTKNGIYMEKRYRYSCRAPMSDPASLKIYLSKEETRACNPNEGGKCHRVNHTCEVKVCDAPKDCVLSEQENKTCSPKSENVTRSSLEIHWKILIVVIFTVVVVVITFFVTKYFVEKRIKSRPIQGSPHYISSHPNQYASLPTKDWSVENNKPKRQPSFSGSSTIGRSKVTNNGTLNKSNNNLMNQNTPKILKYQNDTDTATLKRNSALNNMRLKHIEDDRDKY